MTLRVQAPCPAEVTLTKVRSLPVLIVPIADYAAENRQIEPDGDADAEGEDEPAEA